MSKRSAVLAAAMVAVAAIAASAQGPGMGPGAGPGAGPGGPGMGKGRMDRKVERKMVGPDGPGMGRLLPPGTWWRDSSTVTAIGLSPEQQKKIDGIFLESRVQLIHMHASIQEAQLRLDDTLSAPTLDAAKAQKEADEIADTRASLEKADVHMLLSIRGVLSADQWTKLQALRPHDGPGRPGRVPGSQRGMRRDGPPDNGMPHPPAPGQRPDGPQDGPQDDDQQ